MFYDLLDLLDRMEFVTIKMPPSVILFSTRDYVFTFQDNF